MRLPRPRSLNGLILVGLGLVALPLLVAVIWTLFNLDRLATQSAELVSTGEAVAESRQRLSEQVISLERAVLQYQVLRSPEVLQLVQTDLMRFSRLVEQTAPLAERANASLLAASLTEDAREIVGVLMDPQSDADAQSAAVGQFADLRRRVERLTEVLSAFVDDELSALQETARSAQRISAWQIGALVPGTLVLILIFTSLVARPIRQIDRAIGQLGESGFSKPIVISGPTDLERLGRQLDWLRLRLLELAQEKNKFLRHMSHELKTPLANIREGTELLLDGSVGELDASQREVTSILRVNGLKLQQLIENLLSFSAWQTKSEVLTLSDFELSKLVVSVARTQRLALKAANIQLRLEVEDAVINADQEKIRTVLDNLLSNAIKFTPRGGLITIRGYRATGNFVIEFGDTGPGVPDDESPRIFDAFFQGRRQQGGQVGGTGIGLSVVQECIQAHDGSVELVDSDEFPGAHFRIHIPQSRHVEPIQRVANE